MKTLIVITGPTASGKTALAVALAKRLGTSVISADSRQIYQEIPIGTAAPSPEDTAAVPHYFIATHTLDQYFSAWEFERQALQIIEKEFAVNDNVIVCGGSMMYVDALVYGLDDIPTISPQIRAEVDDIYRTQGLAPLLEELERLDPDYYNIVDRNNSKRVIHAVEIIRQSGTTYTALRTSPRKKRPFRILYYSITLPREILFQRISTRVDRMMDQGMVDEARSVYQLRHHNSLNTVGYKELFAWFDGTMTYEEAVKKIKRNTRVFAKKQETWLKKNPDVRQLDGTQSTELLVYSLLNEVQKL